MLTRPDEKKSAPGGTFPKPNATITAPGATGEPTYYTAATAAYPTQTGTISECGDYYLVVAGDDCATVDLRFGLNYTQLQEYNTYLDATCSNLWLNYDICVAPVTAQTVSTDGTCPLGVTCVGSAFGDCCSPFGYCGTGSDYCVTTTNGTATQDGTCGPDYGGTTCIPQFGDCCSIYVSEHPSYPLQSLIIDKRATAAMAPPIVVQGTAILAVVILIMAARLQMESVARILPETRPALVLSLELVGPYLVIVEAPVTTVLGQTAIAVLVRRNIALAMEKGVSQCIYYVQVNIPFTFEIIFTHAIPMLIQKHCIDYLTTFSHISPSQIIAKLL